MHPVTQLIESSQHQVELLQLSSKMADKMEEQGSCDVSSQDVRPSNPESSEVPESMDMEETRGNEGATATVRRLDTEETTNNIELEQANDVVETSEAVHSETAAAQMTQNQVL